MIDILLVGIKMSHT